MIINHNIPAINAQGDVSQNTHKTGKTPEKTSSGPRLNRTRDDAAVILEITPGRTEELKQAGQDIQGAVPSEDGDANEITTVNDLQVGSENKQSAESQIQDIEMANEMMEFTRLNILTHPSTAIMAQSKMQPQNVLKLLE